MQPPLERAAEMYRRHRLLEESNRAFAALRANPEAWSIEQAERETWDMTLADGLIATRCYRPMG